MKTHFFKTGDLNRRNGHKESVSLPQRPFFGGSYMKSL